MVRRLVYNSLRSKEISAKPEQTKYEATSQICGEYRISQLRRTYGLELRPSHLTSTPINQKPPIRHQSGILRPPQTHQTTKEQSSVLRTTPVSPGGCSDIRFGLDKFMHSLLLALFCWSVIFPFGHCELLYSFWIYCIAPEVNSWIVMNRTGSKFTIWQQPCVHNKLTTSSPDLRIWPQLFKCYCSSWSWSYFQIQILNS